MLDMHRPSYGTRNPGLGFMAKALLKTVLYVADSLLHPNSPSHKISALCVFTSDIVVHPSSNCFGQILGSAAIVPPMQFLKFIKLRKSASRKDDTIRNLELRSYHERDVECRFPLKDGLKVQKGYWVVQIVLWTQFCVGGLEVAFRTAVMSHRNLFVDLLKGSRTTNLYSISLNDMMSASPVCLLTKASSTKSWLWHRRLNHLNFGTLNELARNNLVRGLPMLKYDKDHLCPSCQLGKSKKASHPLKTENTNTEVLNTLHMDLCGPMRTESINGKKYVLVIVDDFYHNKHAMITPDLVDNGTEFVYKDTDGGLRCVGISHERAYSVSTTERRFCRRTEPNSYGRCRTCSSLRSSTVSYGLKL
ncbi:retrovirus-related pol polyprotein from transposon TNT 1-94 [Tanacetum coccineum]|uniref:Retrovirus-related pol polyprotein from transposon TNT 1-94 n=1 Tax=Tanacetum coccineum TaxID=301880 RepID=A0ABQ5E918_9ASTR